jgi:hypothetical protein
MKKKVVFLGASNTFGVGLWFFRDIYNELTNLELTRPNYFHSLEDKEFIKKYRFSRLVSDYLNLKEVNESAAGGSPAQSLYLLSKMNLDEIEYVVFEFSSITSFFDRYMFEHTIDKNKLPKTPGEIENFLTNGKNDRPELRKSIYNWLENYDPNEFTKEIFYTIKEFIENNKHIKFTLLFWRRPDVEIELLKHNSWVLNYTPTFLTTLNDKNIFVEEYLTEKKLRICDEFVHIDKMEFSKNHPEIHPSLNGHKTIFEVLKSYIDEKNSTNSW